MERCTRQAGAKSAGGAETLERRGEGTKKREREQRKPEVRDSTCNHEVTLVFIPHTKTAVILMTCSYSTLTPQGVTMATTITANIGNTPSMLHHNGKPFTYPNKQTRSALREKNHSSTRCTSTSAMVPSLQRKEWHCKQSLHSSPSLLVHCPKGKCEAIRRQKSLIHLMLGRQV